MVLGRHWERDWHQGEGMRGVMEDAADAAEVAKSRDKQMQGKGTAEPGEKVSVTVKSFLCKLSVISTLNDCINILITLINFPRKEASVAGDSRYLKESTSSTVQAAQPQQIP